MLALNLSDWGIIGSVLGGAAVLPPVWRFGRQWLRQRRASRSLPDDLYHDDELRRATQYYIRPRCVENDPSETLEFGRTFSVSESLFSAVDRFIDDDTGRRVMLVLADSGMGKTSFLLNYVCHNNRKLFGRKRMVCIPLASRKADEAIDAIVDKREVVLLLDAFDEDPKAHKDHVNRLKELMERCGAFRRVIMTCRSQFFASQEDIPSLLDIPSHGAADMGEGDNRRFWRTYIASFSEEEVRQYIGRRYPLLTPRFYRNIQHRRRAMKLASRVHTMKFRPMVLAYLPNIIDSDSYSQTLPQIYRRIVDGWIDRERQKGFWKSERALMDLSLRASLLVLKKRASGGDDVLTPEELGALAEKSDGEIEKWETTSRSLLNRTAAGEWKFAHRTIWEYLAACAVIEPHRDAEMPSPQSMTEMMTEFLFRVLRDLIATTASEGSAAPFDRLAPDHAWGLLILAYASQGDEPYLVHKNVRTFPSDAAPASLREDLRPYCEKDLQLKKGKRLSLNLWLRVCEHLVPAAREGGRTPRRLSPNESLSVVQAVPDRLVFGDDVLLDFDGDVELELAQSSAHITRMYGAESSAATTLVATGESSASIQIEEDEGQARLRIAFKGPIRDLPDAFGLEFDLDPTTVEAIGRLWRQEGPIVRTQIQTGPRLYLRPMASALSTATLEGVFGPRGTRETEPSATT